MKDMREWIKNAAAERKPLPILSFPGVQVTGKTVSDLVHSGRYQADCMKAIADRYDNMLASLSLMDLSVEAEAFGSPIHYDDGEVPTVTAPIINNMDDAQALKVPTVGDCRTGECVKAIEYASKEITDRPVIAGTIGPFSLAGRLMDMTEIMIKCFTDPDEVHVVLEKCTEFLIAYNNKMKAAGANGILIAEPAAGLLTPEFMSNFSSAYVKRIIDEVEDENCVIIYHNCGNDVLRLTDQILETTAIAYSFGNAINLEEMFELLPPDAIIMGNLDPTTIFRNGTPEVVDSATKSLVEKCAKYPNFILSSGCDIPPMSPLENVDAFFGASEKYWK